MTNANHHHALTAYRPDIDGLRAIAILLVVVYHAFPTALPGGFVGVDVFFVISGYLISTLIWSDLDAGRFSYLDFYGRRARRIFPALGVMLAFTLTVGYFLLLPVEYEQLGKHTAGGSAFVQNFVLRSEAGYFDTASTTKPLLHLWSLAIEEQFYLLLPLLLVLVHARRLSPVTVIAGLMLLSFTYGLERAFAEPERSFFNPLVRFWELLAGTLLASLQRQGLLARLQTLSTNPQGERGASALGFVGLSLVLISAGIFSKTDAYPSWRALLPVLGAVFVLAAGMRSGVNAKWLSVKPMLGIGLISYSLYLWHWPLITFAHVLNKGDAPWSARAAAVFISVALAYLTYRFVETPMRKAQPLSKAAFASVGIIVTCAAAGLLVASADGLPGRDSEVDQVAESIGSWEYPGDMERLGLHTNPRMLGAAASALRVTLFLGDSNIEHYYSRVDELVKSQAELHRGAIFITGGGCLPIPGIIHGSRYDHCRGMPEFAVQEALTNSRIDRVVIGATWNSYLAHGLRVEGQWGRGGKDYQDALVALNAAILNLTQRGLEVFLILNAPSGLELDPRNAVQRDLSAFPDVLRVKQDSIDRFEFEKRYAEIQSDLVHAASSAGALIIRPADHLCTQRCNALTEDGLPIYKDASHLNPLFVRKHATFIDDVMSIKAEQME